MCAPVIAAAGLAATVLSTGVAIKGSMDSAAAQSNSANYNAQVARNEAILRRQQGDVAAEAAQRAGNQKLSAQRAALGASGIDVNSGSAFQIQEATASSTGFDVANTRYNALLGSSQATSSANLSDAAGANAGPAGALSATGSLLGGASQFASQWNSYQQNFGGGATPARTTMLGHI